MANESKKNPNDLGSDGSKSESSKSEKSENKISDTIKKIISSGSASEMSKEILSTVLTQALKAKDDVSTLVTNEMIALIRKIDFVKEFSKFAENHKFKVTAEIEILKKENNHSEAKIDFKSDAKK